MFQYSEGISSKFFTMVSLISVSTIRSAAHLSAKVSRLKVMKEKPCSGPDQVLPAAAHRLQLLKVAAECGIDSALMLGESRVLREIPGYALPDVSVLVPFHGQLASHCSTSSSAFVVGVVEKFPALKRGCTPCLM